MEISNPSEALLFDPLEAPHPQAGIEALKTFGILLLTQKKIFRSATKV
jgi:hypothetical protein